jgi:hypothetical protein
MRLAPTSLPNPPSAPPSQDKGLLVVLALLTACSLFKGYQQAEALAVLQPASGRKVVARTDAERAWFAVFQQNMVFLSVFAFFAYVLLPQFETREIPRFPWVHAAGSVVPAALTVLLFEKL